VVYISASASGYGSENSLFMLVNNLPEGIEPIVIVPEEGPLTEKLKKAKIRIVVFPYAVLHRKYFHPLKIIEYKLFLSVSVFKFLGLFIRIKPDIIHSNTSQVMPAAFAAKILGIPHIWHIREIPNVSPSLWSIWRWFILRFSTKVICISSAVKRQFGKNRKAIVIWNGIDVSLFPPHLTPLPTGARETEGKRVGMVGRINYWKGQDLFIESANIILKEQKGVEFFIIGDARKEYRKLEEELYRRVKEYGISENVAFTGFLPREKTFELLGNFDVFVLTSIQPEPFGLVVIEAMASGRAVIAPAEGGPLDIIENGVSGMLVEPRNPCAYAKAILYLLENDEVREQMGWSGRKRVEEKFTIERTVSEIVGLYMDIISDRK
jgi:glycosyltransferase involved in cell wall biosynthesis